jgi:acetate kinase
LSVLVLNCGSSTVKFKLFRLDDSSRDRPASILAKGAVSRLGPSAELSVERAGGAAARSTLAAPDAGSAVETILEWLAADLGEKEKPAAVGHRVVHGGRTFTAPALVSEKTLASLEELSRLAPLHNPSSLQGIRAAMEALGPAVPNVAVFDTSFHGTLPPEAATYPIPKALTARHGVRRHGFHGIAHQSLVERYAELRGIGLEGVTIVTLHLGSGCSACAVKNGRSVDTSMGLTMGLTPLEGLMMGTRSGDLDPAILPHLAREERVPVEDVERWLNQDSGLLGVTGRSADMRDIVAGRNAGDADCRLAFSMFAYRAKKYLGAYLAALGGAEAVVFGGGIGENSPETREAICQGMEWCGLHIDSGRNASLAGSEGLISAERSAISAWVLPVEEERLIARETLEVLEREGSSLR